MKVKTMNATMKYVFASVAKQYRRSKHCSWIASLRSQRPLKICFYLQILTSTLLLTSCTSTYAPQHPITIPKTWNTTDSRMNAKNCNIRCLAWWTQFNDPTLNHLVEDSLRRNNDIHIAIANIEAAQGELKRVKLNWVPSLDANLGYSSFPYLGYPGVLVTAVPTYTLNIFKQIKEQKRANYELQITKNMRDTVKLAVIAQITGQYFSYLAQSEQLHLLQQVEHDLAIEVSIYQAMYKNGLSSEIRWAQSESELDLIKAKKLVIQRNIVISQNAMRYLLNENPQPFHFKRSFNQLNSQKMLIGTLPLNVIENRPDMVQATNELRASNINVGIAVSNFLPTIQLSAARGDIATVPNGTTLGTPVYFNQALLETPLLHLSYFGQLDKARALNKASYFRYLNTLRNVLREVNDDLASHDYLSLRLEQTMQAQTKLLHAYQLTDDLYHQGIISDAHRLEERIKLDKIKLRVNQHKLEQIMAIVNLYQHLAVGYECPRVSASNSP